jgi:hypothetical protein
MSKSASFDLSLNRGLLFVGSTADPRDERQFFRPSDGSERPAVMWTDTHVLVRVRPQVALVRVEIWHGNAPIAGEVLFDGTLNLPDGMLSVSEYDRINSAQSRFGAWGDHRVTIRVDDQGWASRVVVIRDRADGERPLTTVHGHELPAVTAARDEFLPPGIELDLILSAHDLPLSRLAAAIKVLLTRDEPTTYRTQLIAEWLRWTHPTAGAAHCRALGARLLTDLLGPPAPDVDTRSLHLARELLDAAGTPWVQAPEPKE